MLDEKLAAIYRTRETLSYLAKALRDPGIAKAAGLEKRAQFFPAPPGLFGQFLGQLLGPNISQSLGFQLPMMLMGQVTSRAVRPAWRPMIRGTDLLSSNLQRLSQDALQRISMQSMGVPFGTPIY